MEPWPKQFYLTRLTLAFTYLSLPLCATVRDILFNYRRFDLAVWPLDLATSVSLRQTPDQYTVVTVRPPYPCGFACVEYKGPTSCPPQRIPLPLYPTNMSQRSPSVSPSCVSVRKSPGSPDLSTFCIPVHRRTSARSPGGRFSKSYKAFRTKFSPIRVRLPPNIKVQIPSVHFTTPSIHVRVPLRCSLPRPRPRSWSSFTTSKRFLRKVFTFNGFALPSGLVCGGSGDATSPPSLVMSSSDAAKPSKVPTATATGTTTSSVDEKESGVVIAPPVLDEVPLQRCVSHRTGQELIIEGERRLIYAVSFFPLATAFPSSPKLTSVTSL